jgi:hypothetical protein
MENKSEIISFCYKLGISILIINFCLFGYIVVEWKMYGFTDGEFEDLVQMLFPIKSLYISLIINFLAEHKFKQTIKAQNLRLGYIHSIVFIVASYIMSLFVIIYLKTVGILEFQYLMNLIVIIESVFGGYAGYMINDLFRKNDR